MSSLVNSFFSADHDRLDFIFEMYQKNKNEDRSKAKQFFTKFCEGLNRHIDWEEQLLFPEFDNAMGTHGFGPTAVMRNEHEQIKSILEQMNESFDDYATTSRLEQNLVEILRSHNDKEENILYPHCDRALSEDTVASIFLNV